MTMISSSEFTASDLAGLQNRVALKQGKGDGLDLTDSFPGNKDGDLFSRVTVTPSDFMECLHVEQHGTSFTEQGLPKTVTFTTIRSRAGGKLFGTTFQMSPVNGEFVQSSETSQLDHAQVVKVASGIASALNSLR